MVEDVVQSLLSMCPYDVLFDLILTEPHTNRF